MFEWTPSEVLKPPSDEEVALMEPEELIEVHRLYHEWIGNAQADPYRFGYRIPRWSLVEKDFDDFDEVLILGGNRSSKTAFSALAVVKAAIENPNSEIFCFCQNADVSIRQQQSAVYYWLPPELKQKSTGETTYISYTKKNGFSDSSLILPNGSQIIFKTYAQFQNNDTILEGAELGSKNPKWINIGVWLDEYLLGPELIETMRFRLATRNSKMLISFTPIEGWTEVIREYLDGAKTIEWKNAELLKGEKVPFIQRSKKRNAAVHYFHSEDNPFGGYERIKSDLAGQPREKILIRAYGVPTKSFSSKFPRFSKDLNVVAHDKIPDKDVTRYCIIDPAGRKNWFITWIAVDAAQTWWVYREWPDISEGEWAEQGQNGKWKAGPGAKGQGKGIKDYIDLIHGLEGEEEIFEYLIDPRLGASKYQSADGESSIIEDLEEHDFVAVPAPGGGIEDGIQKLVDKMAYDVERPVDGTNHPHYYISEKCENTIAAMAEYTGDDGKDEAWKDPIDTQRYAACADIDHIPAEANVRRRSRGGY